MSNLITQQKQPPSLQLKEISIIPITVPVAGQNQTQIVPASTSITITGNTQQAADDSRKKRCTDRYDSSESSDSGVNTLSCTDSNTTSSDTSDPGSPYSHTSVSDDAHQQQTNNCNNSNSNVNKNLKRQSLTQTDKSDKKRAKKDDKNNNNGSLSNRSNLEIKIIPVSSNNSTPHTVNNSSNTTNGSKLAKSPFANSANLQLLTGKNGTKKSDGNNTSTNQSLTIIPPLTQPPSLSSLSATSDNKLITNYYKLTKDPQNVQMAKDLQNFLYNGSANSNNEKSNIEKYCNLLGTQLQAANAKNKLKPTVVGATTQTTPMTKTNKKIGNEKKTAKIAPIIPVARKTSVTTQTNQQSQLKISPKKPVTIAPRIIEPKLQTVAKQTNQINTQSPQKSAINNNATNQNNSIDNEKSSSAPSSTVSSPQHHASSQNGSQPALLVVRIPPQQMPQQPPPLKIQNGLLHKTTTTTTTTTTKLAPLLQFHPNQMIPNLIQIPNLLQQLQQNNAAAAAAQAQKSSASVTPSTTPQLYMNSLHSNGSQSHQHALQQASAQQQHQQHQQQQQQLFMNGAVIKLQPIMTSSAQSMQPVTTTSTTNVPLTSAQQNQHNKYALTQQQIYAAAAQQLMTQQLFMTTPVFAASIPTMLTSQIQQQLQHAYNQQQQHHHQQNQTSTSMPALQPIQQPMLTSFANINGSNASTSTSNTLTNNIALPSFSTLLHHPQAGVGSSQFAPTLVAPHGISNIPISSNLMKTTTTTNIIQNSQTAFPQLPPSLTITSNFMPTQHAQQPTQMVQNTADQQSMNTQQNKAIITAQQTNNVTSILNSDLNLSLKTNGTLTTTKIPPLAPTTPISINNLPKLVPVSPNAGTQTASATTQTTPQIPPPPLIKVSKIPTLTPKIKVAPVYAPPIQKIDEPSDASELVIDLDKDTDTKFDIDHKASVEKLEEMPVKIEISVSANEKHSDKKELIQEKEKLKEIENGFKKEENCDSKNLTTTSIPLSSPKVMKSSLFKNTPMKVTVETEETIEIHKEIKNGDKTTEISIVVEEKSTLEVSQDLQCAKSPILSQPKTIRFPPVNGKITVWRSSTKGKGTCCVRITKNGMCNWEKCNKKFDTNSELLDHLQQQHVNVQNTPFVCSWADCKVNGHKSKSKHWLERHILLHVGRGTKPFKCIVERCGMRFSSQIALEKHVNGHFNLQENQNANKRASDPPVPKKLKQGIKKTRIRRQPWSARRFDYFDVGMMELLQNRLKVTESLVGGPKVEMTFKGSIKAKRTSKNGDEFLIEWQPKDIIENEWIKKPESKEAAKEALIKNVSILKMKAEERTRLDDYVRQLTKRTLDGEKAKIDGDIRRSRKPSQSLQSSSFSSNNSSIYSINELSLSSI